MNYVRSLDISSSWSLTTADLSMLKNLEYLNVNFSNLSSMTLCEEAPLRHLDLGNSYLLKYDASAFKNTLEYLNLYALEFSEDDINLKEFTNLDTLDIGYNKFRSLDLSGMTKLKRLSAMTNYLQSIDFSGCSSLEKLTVSYNNISQVNLDGCTSLTGLYIQNNYELTELDLSPVRQTLQELNVNNTALTTLDLAGFEQLTYLEMVASKLTEMPDLSDCGLLEEIRLDECANIKTVELSGFSQLKQVYCMQSGVESIVLTDLPALNSVTISGNTEMTEATLRNLPAVGSMNLTGNKFVRIDLSQGLNQTGTYNLLRNNSLKEIKPWEGYDPATDLIWKDDTAEFVTEFSE